MQAVNFSAANSFLFEETFSFVRIQNTFCVALSRTRDSPTHRVDKLQKAVRQSGKRTDIVSPMLQSEIIIFGNLTTA